MKPTDASETDAQPDSRPVIVLFLHGSGDTGPNFRAWLESHAPIESLVPENAIALFPSAPRRPYTMANGREVPVWFDRHRLHYEDTEDPSSMAQSITFLSDVLAQAVSEAGDNPRIVFFGFSMGGSMALHLAFHRLNCGLATHGVLVQSSFVGRFSTAIPDLSQSCDGDRASRQGMAPLLKLLHGTADAMVPVQWGSMTATRLLEKGFVVEFSELQGLHHQISQKTVDEIAAFVKKACGVQHNTDCTVSEWNGV